MRTHRDNIAYQANLSDIKSIIEDFKFLEESEIKRNIISQRKAETRKWLMLNETSRNLELKTSF